MSDDFDFDLGSDDAAEMLAAGADTTGKRNFNNDNGGEGLPNKRAKIGHNLSNVTSPSTLLANRILKERFGLKGFRLEQEAAITRVLGGGSAVVVFPTGGGKSLCYQVNPLREWSHDFADLPRYLPYASDTKTRRLAGVYHNAMASLSSYHHSSL
jgi:hypothetical protein